jgi:asparagine synthase (glutamine-hydrolysing)
VGLGVQRLRIIDLATGDQPIYNEDRSVVVVLNGEIYNFQKLREQLEQRGHRFASRSDTEVIVHLYEEEGPACVRSLHGMFAFALWDARRRQLLLARDRVGKKPLIYRLSDSSLTFASEFGTLLANPAVPREVDHQALDCYLAYQYVPAPLTAFRGIRKLPPASTLLYRDGRATIETYWSLDYGRKRIVNDLPALHEQIRETIRATTRRRLVSDVPLGAFLSGGIDSSAVVAAMAESSPERVKTFSIGFETATFNELPFARQIAREFDTDHHEFVVRPDAVEIIPRIVRHYGEPFADASAIPCFYIAEMTRRHVTVALNGDGGDESFAGYNRYLSNLVANRLSRLPRPARRVAGAVGDRLPTNSNMRSTLSRGKRLLRSLSLDGDTRYARHMSYFDAEQRDEIYTPEFQELVGESLAQEVISRPWREASGHSPLDVMLEVDVNTYLPGDLLVKMDIATMAHSLEARSPFLDPELMELAASLPAYLKIKGTEKKVALRDALRGWIPDSILDRPKVGFAVPIADWFRGELRGYVTDVLCDPATRERGYFRAGVVESILDRHIAGNEDTSPRIWALLMFELWHREFIDPEPHGSAGG